MSDSEEDFVEYGTGLEPLEDDEIPRKRPLNLEDQVVKDAQGRRRFHGAFTGGFSAGFFNTVGSLEGWTPSSFKSSRSERMESKSQKPEDFMDDEDTGEFGIAPRVLRATGDFTHLKRSRERAPRSSDGPIPGEPVLKLLLEPVRETAGVRLLRRMGWRPGQGVGPRVAPRHRHKDKDKDKDRARRESRRRRQQPRARVVGCEPPPGMGAPRSPDPEHPPSASASSSVDSDDDEVLDAAGITFAPEETPEFFCNPKADSFGLGYKGLDRRAVLSSGAAQAKPVVLGGGRGGTLTVAGQAFGVGALEEDDDDIYALEDMSQYDFALGEPASSRWREQPSAPQSSANFLDNFVRAARVALKEYYPPPQLPPGFRPLHQARRSRFDEPAPGSAAALAAAEVRRARSATERAAMVGGDDDAGASTGTPCDEAEDDDDDGDDDARERERLRAEALKLTQEMGAAAGAPRSRFVPFAGHPDKQRRYEQYLALLRAGQAEKLSHLQPLSMNGWERQREKREFEQAARLFRPLSADMGDRFVSASQPDDATDPMAQVEKYMGASSEQRDAAKKKMFGKLTREEEPWQPCDLLCKRFNIAKPNVSNTLANSQNKKRVSVFDFLKAVPHNSLVDNSAEQKPLKTLSSLESANESDSLNKDFTGNLQEKPEKLEEPVNKIDTSPQIENSSIDENKLGKTQNKKEDIFLDPTEKVDLFKAIFLSSSESEEEDDKDTDKIKDEKETSKTHEAELSHFVASAPASTPVTIQDAPKRSLVLSATAKSGVFANLDLDALSYPSTSTSQSVSTVKVTEPKQNMESSLFSLDDSVYGPRLPSLPSKNIDSVRALPSVVAPPQRNSPPLEWVEISAVPKNKKAKKKKEKKHKEKKSKHKKHKHRK